ncbi:hypothetical protein OHR68_13645 [Spirillospora sp. NBC_00431]
MARSTCRGEPGGVDAAGAGGAAQRGGEAPPVERAAVVAGQDGLVPVAAVQERLDQRAHSCGERHGDGLAALDLDPDHPVPGVVGDRGDGERGGLGRAHPGGHQQRGRRGAGRRSPRPVILGAVLRAVPVGRRPRVAERAGPDEGRVDL